MSRDTRQAPTSAATAPGTGRAADSVRTGAFSPDLAQRLA